MSQLSLYFQLKPKDGLNVYVVITFLQKLDTFLRWCGHNFSFQKLDTSLRCYLLHVWYAVQWYKEYVNLCDVPVSYRNARQFIWSTGVECIGDLQCSMLCLFLLFNRHFLSSPLRSTTPHILHSSAKFNREEETILIWNYFLKWNLLLRGKRYLCEDRRKLLLNKCQRSFIIYHLHLNILKRTFLHIDWASAVQPHRHEYTSSTSRLKFQN